MTSGLEVRSLDAGYGRATVVRSADLSVEPGEVVALLGANGAGKSTLLGAISGLGQYQSGEVRLGDLDLTKQRDFAITRAGLVHVPESRSLFPTLTVDEHLRLATGRGGDRSRAYDVFPALTDLSTRAVGLLSGGEKQMVALARALLLSPRVLMVDELSLGLAPIIVESILDTLVRAAAEIDMGVLLVEQHTDIALRYVGSAYVLSRGELSDRWDAAVLAADGDILAEAYLARSAPSPEDPLI